MKTHQIAIKCEQITYMYIPYSNEMTIIAKITRKSIALQNIGTYSD